MVTMLPFSIDRTGLFFRGKIRFLEKAEALEKLNRDALSRKFLEKQELLPVDLLRRMVKIDRSELKKGVRAVRILHKDQSEGR